MSAVFNTLSTLAMPLVTVLVGMLFLFGKKNYFDAFLKGAKDGMKTTLNLFPTLIALMVAIAMLNASGAVEAISSFLSPVADALGVPTDLMPLLLTRPFSGSASTASFSALLNTVGADSFAGLCASVIFASSDTMVYVIAVYFSSVGIKRTRWAFPCAIAVMLFCLFFSCFLCRKWFF